MYKIALKKIYFTELQIQTMQQQQKGPPGPTGGSDVLVCKVGMIADPPDYLLSERTKT